MSYRRTTGHAVTLGVLTAPMLLALHGSAAATEPAGEPGSTEVTSATRPASEPEVLLLDTGTSTEPAAQTGLPTDPVPFDPAAAVAEVLAAPETASGPAPHPAATDSPRPPRGGPVTALVDGLVGPTGLLGGQGLVAGLVGGLLDGPLVQVGVDVSPQVNIGSIASTGDVTQVTAR